MSNSKLNKLKSGIRNGTKVNLNLSSNVKLCKTFANNSSTNIKLSKTLLHKIGQSRGFFGRPLLKTALKNVLKSLAKIF